MLKPVLANRLPALSAVLLSLIVGVATGAESARVEQTFPLKPDGRVKLDNVNGRVEVRSWTDTGVKMEAVKEGRNAEVVAGIKIHTQSTADELSIKTELAKIRRGWWRGNSHEGTVNYVLYVPAGVELGQVSTVNGSVTVAGVKGAVKAGTVNGNIKAEGLEGPAKLETVNGNIDAAHVAVPATGRLEATSVNGNIDLRLPAKASAELDASTVNGSIRSDVPFTVTTKSARRDVEARLGEGGTPIRLGTVNGSIRLHTLANEHAAIQ